MRGEQSIQVGARRGKLVLSLQDSAAQQPDRQRWLGVIPPGFKGSLGEADVACVAVPGIALQRLIGVAGGSAGIVWLPLEVPPHCRKAPGTGAASIKLQDNGIRVGVRAMCGGGAAW